jgi:chromosome segregation ATPase
VLNGTAVVDAANQATLSKTELEKADDKLKAAKVELKEAKVELEKAEGKLEKAEGKLEKAKKGGDENSIKRAEASCEAAVVFLATATDGVATAQRMVTKLSDAVPVGQGK